MYVIIQLTYNKLETMPHQYKMHFKTVSWNFGIFFPINLGINLIKRMSKTYAQIKHNLINWHHVEETATKDIILSC